MLTRIRRLPSPALVIGVLALVVAIGGGAFAVASDRTQDKRIAKKVAKKVVKKAAPSLSVSHANTAGSATTAGTANAAFQGFDESGPSMPGSLTANGNPLDTMQIPTAGHYVISATLYANQLGSAADLAECKLAAGGNSDDVHVSVPANGSHESSIALQTAHTFTAPGTVTLACTDLNNANSDIHAEAIRITAVQVASLTSTNLG